MKKIFLALAVLFALQNLPGQEYKYPFQNPLLEMEERVLDLVGRMTLEEKTSQMLYESPAVERLGVPSYNWWNECLHGVARAGQATVFPQGIGLAATFDDDLMFRIANAISDEARAKHHEFIRQDKRGIYQGLTFWTPNINIFRDPRWGRGQETYGEDPFLTAKLALPFVKGLQGDDPKYLKTVATIKHFAVHSGPEPLRHKFDAQSTDRDLIETYLYAFREIVENTNLESVMCAYNRFRGEACCGSTELLQTYLRDRWGFKGYIVSDCWAIRDFYTDHQVAADAAEASALAVKRGTDLNCGVAFKALNDAVRRKLITEAEIDTAVVRLFRARFKLGMFDPPEMVDYARIPMSEVNSAANQELALEAAYKSVVLLKNNGVLPLKKTVKNVAVIGPVADDEETLWGNYCGYNKNGVTVLEGIKRKLPNANVRFELGCELSESFPQLESVPEEVLYLDSKGKEKGVWAQYYDNSGLWKEPKHSLVQQDINHVWWDKSPYPDIPADDFGARYETYIRIPETGRYALGVEGFYGFSYYVNDSLIFNYRSVHHPRKRFFLKDCVKDEMVKIRIEYNHKIVNHALIRLLWGRSDNDMLMKRAVNVAKKSDVVILCMGINQNLEGEEMNVQTKGFAGGDRTEIELPETQRRLIKEIKKLGKPTVLVLQNGSPLSVDWEDQNLDAIVEGWYGGQSAGTAITDVLFGDYNPSGRLPVTVYRSLDQLPEFTDYSMKGRTYRYFHGEPLYEFGYGMSYTTFEYTNFSLPSEVATNGTVKVLVDVTNTGKMDGEEVVQLYLSHKNSGFDAPIRALKGFQRINLEKGETKRIDFTLNSEELAVVNEEGREVVMPGNIEISVGGKQPDQKSVTGRSVVTGNIRLSGPEINM